MLGVGARQTFQHIGQVVDHPAALDGGLIVADGVGVPLVLVGEDLEIGRHHPCAGLALRVELLDDPGGRLRSHVASRLQPLQATVTGDHHLDRWVEGHIADEAVSQDRGKDVADIMIFGVSWIDVREQVIERDVPQLAWVDFCRGCVRGSGNRG
jgi:hypothetical protein